MSGRYVVRKIHHKISTTKDNHIMNLELIKDAVRVAYPEENLDILSKKENQDSLTYLQYELDDTIIDIASNEVMA